MESFICLKHRQEYKHYCLEKQCKGNRLSCFQCLSINAKHRNHKLINIKRFINGDTNTIQQLFSDKIIQLQNIPITSEGGKQFYKNSHIFFLKLKNEKILTSFKQLLDEKLDQLENLLDIYLGHIGDVRVPRIDELQQMMKDLVKNNNEQIQEDFFKAFQQTNNKDTLKKVEYIQNKKSYFNQIYDQNLNEIKKVCQNQISRIKNTINRKQQNQANLIVNPQQQNIINGYQQNIILIDDWLEDQKIIRFSNSNLYKKTLEEIRKCKHKRQQFQIYLDFIEMNRATNCEHIIKYMIQQQVSNHVSEVSIQVNDDSVRWIDIVEQIFKNFRKIKTLNIRDIGVNLNSKAHNLLQNIAIYNDLEQFAIDFTNNNQSEKQKRMINIYNQILKNKKNLSTIMYSYSKETIYVQNDRNRTIEIINQVEQME